MTTVSVSVYDRDTYEVLASTETDLDGRFAVDNLAAGDVKVQFTSPGFERWAGGAASYDEAKIFTITAGGTTAIDEKLPAPALEGRLTNHADEPAADAKITVYDDEDYEVLGSATTDADGHFEVASLPPGKVKVEFDYHGFDRWVGGAEDYDEARIFTVTAGAITTVNGKLPPLGLFQGRLVDQAGAPVSEVRVVAMEPENSNRPSGTTDEDGRWKLAVPPAEYIVNFDLDGRTQWVKGTRDQEAATLFTIAAGQTITVDETLLPTGTIAGKLVNTKGKAVRDADVTLHQDGEFGRLRPDGRERAIPVRARLHWDLQGAVRSVEGAGAVGVRQGKRGDGDADHGCRGPGHHGERETSRPGRRGGPVHHRQGQGHREGDRLGGHRPRTTRGPSGTSPPRPTARADSRWPVCCPPNTRSASPIAPGAPSTPTARAAGTRASCSPSSPARPPRSTTSR